MGKTKTFTLFILFFCCYYLSSSQDSMLRFKTLSAEDGLSQSIITSVVEDDEGFLWVGTQNGLNRLIGGNISSYHSREGDSLSLPSDQIQSLAVGPNGDLWVGTYFAGLARMDPYKANFHKVVFINDAGKDVSKANIYNILFSSPDELYVAAGDAGLFYYNTDNERAKVYDIRPDSCSKNYTIIDLIIENGEIWLATKHNGLLCFSPDEGIKKHYFYNDQNILCGYNNITKILSGEYPWIWIGTTGHYLHKLNRETGEQVVFSESNDPVFSPLSINSLYKEGPDSLWIATIGSGLQLMDIPSGKITLISTDSMPAGIAYNNIKSICRASNGILWVGTNGKGLSFHHPGMDRFITYSHKKAAHYKLSFESVRCIFSDDKWLFFGGYFGMNRINRSTGSINTFYDKIVPYCFCELNGSDELLLIGTEGNGINLFNKDTGPVKELTKAETDEDGMYYIDDHDFVYSICHFYGQKYLVGCPSGAYVFDFPSATIVKDYKHSDNPGSIPDGEIMNILKDKKGRFWFGSSSDGLARFYPEEERFQRIDTINNCNPIPGNMIMDIMEDSKGRLWVGTNRGLSLFDPDSGCLRNFSIKDGLSSNFVLSIEECKHSHIYCGSPEGISRVDPVSGDVSNYGQSHGLPGKEMNRGCSFSDKNASLYFGGINGAFSFSSDPTILDFPEPKPKIVGYFERNIEIETDTLLAYSKEIIIPPGTEYFSLELTGMDFILDEQNLFKYSLPGFIDDWVDLDKNRRIYFTHMKPGNYSVALAVSNDNKNWIEDTNALSLKVKPRFVQTYFAKALGIFILFALILLVFNLRTHYLKQQQKRLNTLVGQKTKELLRSESELKLANSSKDRFFSILAHDLRSPFSSLLGLSGLLTDDWNAYSEKERIKMTTMIHKNLDHTYKLLNNLLNWSRLQRGMLKPDIQSIGLKDVFDEVLRSMEVQLEAKKIACSIDIKEEVSVSGDVFMISTVIRNLLSNAVKYTPQGGVISIYSQSSDESLRLFFSDTGLGMDKETMAHLFDFTESKSTPGTEGEKGTGLGLIVCKEFISMMKGDFGFSSEAGKGSVFWFSLPSST